MHPYDHQTKAGNQGDVVKHPALVAALHGLLVEHEGVFRYADSFAGRWDNALSASGAWKLGIGRFGERWTGGNPDIQLWFDQWVAEAGAVYPGSTKLATRVLASRGHSQIRAHEIVPQYAAGLRAALGDAAVFTHSATAADWASWMPNLLFIDPPGLRSEKYPIYPTIEALLASAGDVPNVLMWLPMVSDPGRGGPIVPLDDNTVEAWETSLRWGLRVLAVRWHNGERLSGCLLAYRFTSGKVAERVENAVRAVVTTMGGDWRLIQQP